MDHIVYIKISKNMFLFYVKSGGKKVKMRIYMNINLLPHEDNIYVTIKKITILIDKLNYLEMIICVL